MSSRPLEKSISLTVRKIRHEYELIRSGVVTTSTPLSCKMFTTIQVYFIHYRVWPIACIGDYRLQPTGLHFVGCAAFQVQRSTFNLKFKSTLSPDSTDKIFKYSFASKIKEIDYRKYN